MSSAGAARGPPRWVVLDDLDSSINYEGSSWYTASDSKENFETWDNGGFGLTYLGTLHGTDSDAKMSFTFDGSAVLLTGSNNPLNESGIVTPAYECFMDGVKFGEQTTFPFPANNWDICNWSSEDGTGGNHTLSVEIKTDGQSFFADRIKYVPTPGSKAAIELGGGDAGENVVEIPRNDLAIKLGRGWGSLGDTANMTTTNGAKAELNFFGSRLSWWAFIPGELGRSPTTGTYVIDDGNPTSFTLKGLADNQPTTYHQMIFQTPSLKRGPHKMVVTYQGNGRVTPLPLTHVLVTNGNATVPAEGDPTVFDLAQMTTTGPTPSGTGKPGGGSDTVDGEGGTNVGAIAGGVVAGVAVIAAVIFALFFLRRRRQKRNSMDHPVVIPFSPQNNSRPLMEEVHSNDGHHYEGGAAAYGGGGAAPSAYGGSSGYAANSAVSPSTHSNTNTFSTNSGYQNATSRKLAHRAGQASMSSEQTHSTGAAAATGAAGSASGSGSGSGNGFAPRRKGDPVPEGSITSRSHSEGSRVMLHQDSGLRLNEGNEEPVEELPPVYTAR